VALDGTTNHFKGHVAIAPTGEIDGELGLVGTLDAPYGLQGVSNVTLRLSSDESALEFDVDAVHVTAKIADASRAEFSVDGKLTVPQLANLGSTLLGTTPTAVPGADDVSLDRISFSLASGVFSVGAQATVKQLQAAAVLTVRKGAKPLLGLRLTPPGGGGDCLRMPSLPDQAGALSDLKLPALDLVATSLPELAADDLTPQERDFFGDSYATLPDTLHFAPGLNLEGRLPL